jgi:hypothetical protein
VAFSVGVAETPDALHDASVRNVDDVGITPVRARADSA